MISQLWAGVTWEDVYSWLFPLRDGLRINVTVTLITLLLGLPLGLLLAITVQSKSRLITWASLIFVEIGRGTPALVLIQFMYFGLPQTGLTLSSFTAACLALVVSTAAYTSEIIRAGLQAVPGGQHEAAQALNFSTIDELRFVILPQGLRIALPALLGFAILVFQSTSLCFSIALPEILSRANEIGSMTFHYFPAYSLVGAVFAAICIPGSIFVGWIEHRAGHGTQR
ncbi:amino acid ABC transporter permease [Mesorhizobium sp.]|uniref:amino acid ABC transporter permease n=1 Tax=Mesorhizobium sp. TaxID=1871066 RepID=UPI000FE9C965|nr:amino acid ABC transporter permease [Mesorhizobium sp.]RWB69976.1 MAG: amino acid ABC transporter permease [Mesorhizobium sp.]